MTDYWIGLTRNSEICTNYPVGKGFITSFKTEEVPCNDLCLITIHIQQFNIQISNTNGVQYTKPTNYTTDVEFYGQVVNEEDMDIYEALEKL